MSETVISVENLSKRYRLGVMRQDTLRDRLTHAFRSLTSRSPRTDEERADEFWALRDVSFNVKRGEVLGIVGRNGAGKSTLLKILSRITDPTEGRISLRGRVASLLEVGTGFHPELTGRENIFLNGAILGMSRVEIRRKFDEIVAFAEVERFLDTPVKHYSSGMYVRLAFAVAAHLEPEILIVDEVLAVGDTQFQQKCIGRMQQVSRGEGRTVLFVSHNLPAVTQLCSRGLLLAGGRLVFEGATPDVLAKYQSQVPRKSIIEREEADTTRDAFITEVAIRGRNGAPIERASFGEPLFVTCDINVRRTLARAQVALRISKPDTTPVLTTSNIDETRVLSTLAIGRHGYQVQLPAWLAPGRYTISVAICEPQRRVFDVIDDEIEFEVTAQNYFAAALHDDRTGITAPLIPWRHRHEP